MSVLNKVQVFGKLTVFAVINLYGLNRLTLHFIQENGDIIREVLNHLSTLNAKMSYVNDLEATSEALCIWLGTETQKGLCHWCYGEGEGFAVTQPLCRVWER